MLLLCNPTLSKYVLNDTVVQSEIFWCLNAVKTHSSLRTSASRAQLFKRMFPDSKIAEQFGMQKDKICYTILHGLAPFYSTESEKLASQATAYVVLFDEP